MDTDNISAKLSGNSAVPVIFACLLLLLSPVNGQIGHNFLYSVSHNIFGLNMYNVGASKMDFGYYFEVKGLFSNPKTRKSHETHVYASAGLVMQMGPAVIIYLGAGPSLKVYYERGLGGPLDAPKTNITGGVIVTNQGSSPMLRRLSYQVGIDTQPFGVNVGFGFHYTLPFQKRLVAVVNPSDEPSTRRIHAGGWSVLASMHSQPIYDGAFSISHMMVTRPGNDAEAIDYSYAYAVFLPDNGFMVNVERVGYSTARLRVGHRSISLPIVKYILIEGGTHYLPMNLRAEPTSFSHYHFAVGSYLPLEKKLALSKSRKIVLQLNLYLSGLPVSVGLKPAILTADIMVHGHASVRYGRYVLSLDSSARQGIILLARTEQRWIRHIRPIQVTFGYQFGL